jgi:hypothetical protein
VISVRLFSELFEALAHDPGRNSKLLGNSPYSWFNIGTPSRQQFTG